VNKCIVPNVDPSVTRSGAQGFEEYEITNLDVLSGNWLSLSEHCVRCARNTDPQCSRDVAYESRAIEPARCGSTPSVRNPDETLGQRHDRRGPRCGRRWLNPARSTMEGRDSCGGSSSGARDDQSLSERQAIGIGQSIRPHKDADRRVISCSDSPQGLSRLNDVHLPWCRRRGHDDCPERHSDAKGDQKPELDPLRLCVQPWMSGCRHDVLQCEMLTAQPARLFAPSQLIPPGRSRGATQSISGPKTSEDGYNRCRVQIRTLRGRARRYSVGNSAAFDRTPVLL